MSPFTLDPSRWTPSPSFADSIPPRVCAACGEMIDTPVSRNQEYHTSAECRAVMAERARVRRNRLQAKRRK